MNMLNNLEEIALEVEELKKKNGSKQSFDDACNDEKRLCNIKQRSLELRSLFNDWKRDDEEYIKNENILEEISDVNNRMDSLDKDIEDFTGQLNETLNNRKERLNVQNELLDHLNNIDEEIEKINVESDSKEGCFVLYNKLRDIDQRIGLLEVKSTNVLLLVEDCDALNVDDLLVRFKKSMAALNEKICEINQGKEFNLLHSKSEEEFVVLEETLRSIELIEANSDANTAVLKSALEDASIGIKGLGKVHDYLKQMRDLQVNDEICLAINDRILEKREIFDSLAANLSDRISYLEQFNRNAEDLELRIKKAEDAMRDSLSLLNTENFEEIPFDQLAINTIDDMQTDIVKLGDIVQDLTPLEQPRLQFEDLSSRHKKLIDEVKVLSTRRNEMEEMKSAEMYFDVQLDDLKLKLASAEVQLEKLSDKPNSESLDIFIVNYIEMIDADMKRIMESKPTFVSPKTEELNDKAIDLIKRFETLKVRSDDNLLEAKCREKDLERKKNLESNIANISTEGLKLVSKYEVGKVDLKVALNDLDSLRSFIDILLELDIEIATFVDEMDRKGLMEMRDESLTSLKDTMLGLEEDVKNEQELQNDYMHLLEDFNSIHKCVNEISSLPDLSAQLKEASNLHSSMLKLKSEVESLKEKAIVDGNFLQHSSIVDNIDDLMADCSNSLNVLDAKMLNASDQMKIGCLTSELKNFSINLNELTNKALDMEEQNVPLHDQKTSLKYLEERKEELERIIENIPPGYEANDLQKEAFSILNYLKGIINRLNESLGKRQVSFDSFESFKDNVNSQLSTLSVVAPLTNAGSIQDIEIRLNELNVKVADVERLLNEAENIDEVCFDDEMLSEKKKLLNDLKCVYNQLQDDIKNMDDKLRYINQRTKILTAIANLEDLVNINTKVLRVPEADPVMFVDIIKVLEESITNSQSSLDFDENLCDDLLPMKEGLEKWIYNAEVLASSFEEKLLYWKEFNKILTACNELLVDLRDNFDIIKKKEKRSMEIVSEDLKLLKDLYDIDEPCLNRLSTKLVDASQKLLPLDAVSKESNIFEVDSHDLNQEYNSFMTVLNDELEDEKFLRNSVDQLNLEFDCVKEKMNKENDQSKLNEILTQELPALEAQFLSLVAKDKSAQNERSHVMREEMISAEKIDSILRHLIETARERIISINRANEEKELAAIKLELKTLSDVPQENDEFKLLKIDERLSLLPEDSNERIELSNEIVRIRNSWAITNRWNEAKMSMLNNLEKIALEVEELKKKCGSKQSFDEACNDEKRLCNIKQRSLELRSLFNDWKRDNDEEYIKNENILEETTDMNNRMDSLDEYIEDEMKNMDEKLRYINQRAKIEKAIDCLKELVNTNSEVLYNPETNPEIFVETVEKLKESITNSQSSIDSEENLCDDLLPMKENLEKCLNDAEELVNSFEEKLVYWIEFDKILTACNELLDELRKPFDIIKKKEKRSMEIVSEDLKILKDLYDTEEPNLNRLSMDLVDASQKLLPLVVASKKSNIFKDDYLDLHEDYKFLMIALKDELEDEKFLRNSADQLNVEFVCVKEKIYKENVRSKVDEMLTHELPALKDQFLSLLARDESAQNKRSHVMREEMMSAEKIDSILCHLIETARERIISINRANEENELAAIKLELKTLNDVPQEDEFKLLKIDERLSLLPEDSNERIELSNEIIRIRNTWAIINRWNEVKTNMLNNLKEIALEVEEVKKEYGSKQSFNDACNDEKRLCNIKQRSLELRSRFNDWKRDDEEYIKNENILEETSDVNNRMDRLDKEIEDEMKNMDEKLRFINQREKIQRAIDNLKELVNTNSEVLNDPTIDQYSFVETIEKLKESITKSRNSIDFEENLCDDLLPMKEDLEKCLNSAEELANSFEEKLVCWIEFDKIHTACDELLDELRMPYDIFTKKGKRSMEIVSEDIKRLKEWYEIEKLKMDLPSTELVNLSEKLSIYFTDTQVRVFKANYYDLDEDYKLLMIEANDELEDEKFLRNLVDQVNVELDCIKEKISMENDQSKLNEIVRQEVPALQAQFLSLVPKDNYAQSKRCYVTREKMMLVDEMISILTKLMEELIMKIDAIKRANEIKEPEVISSELEMVPQEEEFKFFQNDERLLSPKDSREAIDLNMEVMKLRDFRSLMGRWNETKNEILEDVELMNLEIKQLKKKFDSPQSFDDVCNGNEQMNDVKARIVRVRHILNEWKASKDSEIQTNDVILNDIAYIGVKLNVLDTENEEMIFQFETDIAAYTEMEKYSSDFAVNLDLFSNLWSRSNAEKQLDIEKLLSDVRQLNSSFIALKERKLKYNPIYVNFAPLADTMNHLSHRLSCLVSVVEEKAESMRKKESESVEVDDEEKVTVLQEKASSDDLTKDSAMKNAVNAVNKLRKLIDGGEALLKSKQTAVTYMNYAESLNEHLDTATDLIQTAHRNKGDIGREHIDVCERANAMLLYLRKNSIALEKFSKLRDDDYVHFHDSLSRFLAEMNDRIPRSQLSVEPDVERLKAYGNKLDSYIEGFLDLDQDIEWAVADISHVLNELRPLKLYLNETIFGMQEELDAEKMLATRCREFRDAIPPLRRELESVCDGKFDQQLFEKKVVAPMDDLDSRIEDFSKSFSDRKYVAPSLLLLLMELKDLQISVDAKKDLFNMRSKLEEIETDKDHLLSLINSGESWSCMKTMLQEHDEKISDVKKQFIDKLKLNQCMSNCPPLLTEICAMLESVEKICVFTTDLPIIQEGLRQLDRAEPVEDVETDLPIVQEGPCQLNPVEAVEDVETDLPIVQEGPCQLNPVEAVEDVEILQESFVKRDDVLREKVKSDVRHTIYALEMFIRSGKKDLDDPLTVPVVLRVITESYQKDFDAADKALDSDTVDRFGESDDIKILLHVLKEAKKVRVALLAKYKIWHEFEQKYYEKCNILEGMKTAFTKIDYEERKRAPIDIPAEIAFFEDLDKTLAGIDISTYDSFVNKLRPLVEPVKMLNYFNSEREKLRKKVQKLRDSIRSEMYRRNNLQRAINSFLMEFEHFAKLVQRGHGSRTSISELVTRLSELRRRLQFIAQSADEYNKDRKYHAEEPFSRTDVLLTKFKELERLISSGGSDASTEDMNELREGEIPTNRRRRSRWRRVFFAALPLQALLVLLLGAACLIPRYDNEFCCQFRNLFNFDPALQFLGGAPPI